MQKLIVLVLLFFSLHAISQEKYEIGVSFLSGENDLVSFEKVMGDAGYTGQGFYSVGINYLKPLKSWLNIETGLEYSRHKFTITPNLQEIYGGETRHEKTGLISIPIALRLKFLKYAFVNGGFMVDLDSNLSSSIDSQTGIGALMGIGLKYDFKSGITISANPCARMHSLIAFSSDGIHHRLWESGVKFGIGYKF